MIDWAITITLDSLRRLCFFFVELYESFDGFGLFMGAFLALATFRLFVVPLVGYSLESGSDSVKRQVRYIYKRTNKKGVHK